MNKVVDFLKEDYDTEKYDLIEINKSDAFLVIGEESLRRVVHVTVDNQGKFGIKKFLKLEAEGKIDILQREDCAFISYKQSHFNYKKGIIYNMFSSYVSWFQRTNIVFYENFRKYLSQQKLEDENVNLIRDDNLEHNFPFLPLADENLLNQKYTLGVVERKYVPSSLIPNPSVYVTDSVSITIDDCTDNIISPLFVLFNSKGRIVGIFDTVKKAMNFVFKQSDYNSNKDLLEQCEVFPTLQDTPYRDEKCLEEIIDRYKNGTGFGAKTAKNLLLSLRKDK